MKKDELSRQYAEKKVRESPNNMYKNYHLHRQMECTHFDGYDIQQAYEDGYDGRSAEQEPEIIRMESDWFWGTSVQFTTSDGRGYMKVFIDDSDTKICNICDIIIHPDYRQKGYANRLLSEAEKEARERGCLRLLLWVERGSWMERWYRRKGFVDEEFIKPPDESVRWMEKFL
jgi:GNAT superfamily N-acetyltransferase